MTFTHPRLRNRVIIKFTDSSWRNVACFNHRNNKKCLQSLLSNSLNDIHGPQVKNPCTKPLYLFVFGPSSTRIVFCSNCCYTNRSDRRASSSVRYTVTRLSIIACLYTIPTINQFLMQVVATLFPVESGCFLK